MKAARCGERGQPQNSYLSGLSCQGAALDSDELTRDIGCYTSYLGAMTQAPQPTPFGSYLLDRKLAEGGMAEVFLARQRGLGGFEKQVVVKRILPALSTHADFVQMFLNEARLAARLSHSNVVQVFEAGEVDGRYYISMEYIDGADLRLFYDEAEHNGQPIPPGLACRIIADLLNGLHYAHAFTDENGRPLGIVHRDVSPQNVLVTRNGAVKIVDFGIAKATRTAQQQTQAGRVKGKVAYLSPEQAMGRPLDGRSDVFACGILLWELCTGTRLYARSNDMATIMAITEDDAAAPSSVNPELPEALDLILKQALARNAADRYPSAHAMQAELEAIIRAEGWPGDRRAVERYMASRLDSMTPTFSPPPIPHDPSIAPPEANVSEHPRIDNEFDDGPTMLGSSAPSMASMMSALKAQQKPPIRSASQIASAETMVAMPPSDETPTNEQPKAVVPHAPPAVISAATVMSAPVVVAPMPTPDRPRTPSGMRSMPPTPGPATPQPSFATTNPSATFDPPTMSRPRGTGRRIIVVLTAAILVSVGAIVALDWHPRAKPTVVATGPAHVLVEVEEPTMVEIDGVRTAVATTMELELPLGRQVTVNATTQRSKGPAQTRSITLPPAHPGERIPLKLQFPK